MLQNNQLNIQGNSINICPECGSNKINKKDQVICTNCGLVIVEEHYIASSYQTHKNPERFFSNFKQYVSIGKKLDSVGNLGSYIDYSDKNFHFTDFHGQYLSYETQKLFSRLKKKYSKFSKIKNQETNYRIMQVLAETCNILELNPSIRNDAAYYFLKIKKTNKNIKNNISLIAFCILYAIRNRNQNAPVTINEICEVFQSLGHRVIPKLLIRDGILYKKLIKTPIPHKSEDYLNRLIDGIINYEGLVEKMKKKKYPWDLDEYRQKLLNTSLEILNKIPLYKRGGKNPFIFAGATIYCADYIIAKRNGLKKVLTQNIASKAMGIAEYSIRDHYVSFFKKILVNYFSD